MGLLLAGGCSVTCARAETPPPPSLAGRVAGVLPLGPAATIDVAADADPRVALRVDAWGQTVAIAWAHQDGDVRISMSPDAGRSFRTATVATPPARGALAIAVHAPADLSLPSNDGRADSRVEVWCRVGDEASARVVHSVNGGRSFDASIPADFTVADVFPEPWESLSATAPETLALLPPPLLRYVGVQKATRPPTAMGEGVPALTLDEHGALALLWRERTGAGEAMVLRRYAIDWNGTDATTPEFDAATLLVRDAHVQAPALARVPGGIVAAWIADATLRTRRVGLDMTCNPNRVRR